MVHITGEPFFFQTDEKLVYRDNNTNQQRKNNTAKIYVSLHVIHGSLQATCNQYGIPLLN